jgi:hypothetical protein
MSAFHKGCKGRYPASGSNGRNGCRAGREQDGLIWRLTEQAGRCFPRGHTGGLFGELRIPDILSCSDPPISFCEDAVFASVPGNRKVPAIF